MISPGLRPVLSLWPGVERPNNKTGSIDQSPDKKIGSEVQLYMYLIGETHFISMYPQQGKGKVVVFEDDCFVSRQNSRGLLNKGGNDKNATFSVSPSPVPLYCDIWDCPRCWLALCVFYIINGCNALVITLWNHCEIKHWLLHPPSPSQTNDQHNPI